VIFLAYVGGVIVFAAVLLGGALVDQLRSRAAAARLSRRDVTPLTLGGTDVRAVVPPAARTSTFCNVDGCVVCAAVGEGIR
jgi:hypothetical protein